jgi:hypothetical protein
MAALTNQISIPIDRRKLRWKLFTSFSLMVLGLFWIMNPWDSPYTIFNGYFFLAASIVLVFYWGKRLIIKRPGVVIDQNGIFYDEGPFYKDPVLWNDVTRVRAARILWRNIIVVELKNSQAYISRQKNLIHKFSISISDVFFGSPFCVNTSELDISFQELFEMLKKNFDNYTITSKQV